MPAASSGAEPADPAMALPRGPHELRHNVQGAEARGLGGFTMAPVLLLQVRTPEASRGAELARAVFSGGCP